MDNKLDKGTSLPQALLLRAKGKWKRGTEPHTRTARLSSQQDCISLALRAPYGTLRDVCERGVLSSGDGARNTFFLLDQAQILSYHVQRTCQPACQSTRCWFIRLSHIRDVIRCVEK